MEIERLRWWHWSLLSLALGWLLAYVNSGTVEPTGLRTDREQAFEQAILHGPVGDQHIPWIRNVIVYPAVPAEGPAGRSVQLIPVTYEVLIPMPGGQENEFEYEPSWFGAPIPYLPYYSRQMLGRDHLPNPASGDNHLPPGIEKTMDPDPDATIGSLAAAAFGKDTPEGRQALASANSVLLELPARQAISTLYDSSRLRRGEPLLVPWNPAAQKSVLEWLGEARHDFSFIQYQYAWWKVPQYCNMVWIGSTFVLVGVLWPMTIRLMRGAGLGRQHISEETYDLSRFGKGKGTSASVPRPTVQIGQEELAKVAAMNQTLTASLRETAGSGHAPAPASSPQTQAAKPFVVGSAEPLVPLPQTPEEKKDYEGEFYPVARPTAHEAQEKKEAAHPGPKPS